MFSQTNGSWVRRQTLHPDPGADRFGTAVALDGETAAVGARRRGESSTVPVGEVTLFERSGGDWSRQTTLQSPASEPSDEFGTTLALDGDTLLVGAPTESNDRGDNAGAVHVFTRTRGRWRHRQTLVAPEPVADDQFGTTLALDDDVAMVGRRGRASPAFLTRTDGRWHEQGTPTPDDHRRSRTAVALDGTRALVGVAGSPDSASGVVTVFDA
ncbi:FG-GAP repeat protein [Halovivax cerinus]|uniref:FG-GAP repeat protein n=1 Tax=Halovivax cerinus TaxID=1487865 RepID=A0ABD5NM38_9EURY|nr:FG-GAP repeat protein [Halovivax cerinus]